MESDLLTFKNPKTKWILYGIWSMNFLSIFSCMARADYNVLVGFALLIFLYKNFQTKKKLACKGSLYIIFTALLFDLIWIIIYFSYWSNDSSTSEYWQSLSFIHTVVYWAGIFEFFIKLALAYIIFNNYKIEGGIFKDLIDFKKIE